MSRFIIADPAEACGWGHIFSEIDDLDRPKERERDTRFVWDRAAGALVHLEIMRNHRWESATPAEMADVTESLQDNNAIADPEAWDLLVEDDRPDWATEAPAPVF